MTRVCIVCEGSTESKFVDQVMTAPFAALGIYLQPVSIETSKGHTGGALNYDRVKPFICNTLNQASTPVVTTFFDLYRLDKRFPGLAESQQTNDLAQKLNILCQAFHHDIVNKVSCEPYRFIPYVQAHEFEALLFSDIKTLTDTEPTWQRAYTALNETRQAADSPEHINHGVSTKPKARLEKELYRPRFQNTTGGLLAAKRIGLAKMEAQCHHFAAWLHQLRSTKEFK